MLFNILTFSTKIPLFHCLKVVRLLLRKGDFGRNSQNNK